MKAKSDSQKDEKLILKINIINIFLIICTEKKEIIYIINQKYI